MAALTCEVKRVFKQADTSRTSTLEAILYLASLASALIGLSQNQDGSDPRFGMFQGSGESWVIGKASSKSSAPTAYKYSLLLGGM